MNPLSASQSTMSSVRGREPVERTRARLEALVKANAAPRCGARSKRTGKPCRGKFHGGKSTGPRTPEGLERSRRANWKQGGWMGSFERFGPRPKGAAAVDLASEVERVPQLRCCGICPQRFLDTETYGSRARTCNEAT